MGIRLKGFDYKAPYFYMVTVKKLKGVAPFRALIGESEAEVAARLRRKPRPAGHFTAALSPDDRGSCAASPDQRGRCAAPEAAALPLDAFADWPTTHNSIFLVDTAISRRFSEIISRFHEIWYCIAPIDCFVIMPDHLHLLIRILPETDQRPPPGQPPRRVALGVIVSQLEKALTEAYWQIVDPSVLLRAASAATQPPVDAERARGGRKDPAKRRLPLPPIFDVDWHDWIIKKHGQLKEFNRYIRENGFRAWLRRLHPEYFGKVTTVDFLGRKWYCYGNAALLKLPSLTALKGHRSTAEGSDEWNAMVERAARIGPGGAGVSTFMSPLEKAMGRVLGLAGGRWIVLSPEGFHPRWHPSREYERFCAEGRMAFISLYEAMTRQPTRAELYARCHEMIDLAVEKLK